MPAFPFDRKPLVGVVHLAPLPGSPRWKPVGGRGMGALIEDAVARARAFVDAGFDGLIVENYGDAPFFKGAVPAETIAALTLATRAVIDAAGKKPVGVNVLRNDARAALGIAAATGARFVRVNVLSGVAATDQGIVEGDAASVVRAREALAPEVGIWADVHVKHARPLDTDDIRRAAENARERGLADVLLVSGDATGHAPDEAKIRRAREGAARAPLLLGSGLTAEACPRLAPLIDGAVVASSVLEEGRAGNKVVPARARALVEAFRRA
ncbi:MAG TPA: BtpA/SgcQ family protein [Planctomycetota bacterium]|nr:BtpA/SgcQ family protein [Planctomycetota bacterium]